MRLTALAFLLLAALPLSAQSTKADLEARLLHQPLYLRGLWSGDRLRFNAVGTLDGSSPATTFTLAGVEVGTVKLKSDRLELDGRRVGLTFDRNSNPRRVTLQQGRPPDLQDESVHIDIAAPQSGDYGAALDQVLVELPDLALTLPSYWQGFASKHLIATPVAASPPVVPAVDSPRRGGGAVSAPRVLNMPEPEFSSAARALKQSGNVLVYLQVDKQGKPMKMAIVRPVGLGLDEQALRAVQQYRFVPAMQNGEPVIVEMNVEVNFQIF